MRYRAPEIVLFDLEKNISATKDMLFGVNAPVLIDPHEAVTWVGSGKLSDSLGPLKWRECSPDELSSTFDRGQGRYELAEELVIAAVMQGRVRCAYVRDAEDSAPILSYVDPAIFKGFDVSHGWDESLYFQITENSEENSDDHVNEVLIEKFWFFWSEIAQLVPGRSPINNEASDIPSNVTDVPFGSVRSESPSATPMGTATAHDDDRDAPNKRGRGRPAGKNGEPIAMFVMRVQAEGVDTLDALTDEALGAMLREEYVRLGLTAPESTNAKRDARGVLRALVKMTKNAGS